MRAIAIAALGLALGVMGCEAQNVAQVGQAPREAISYAATAKYPGNAKTSPDVHAAAVDNSGNDTLTIYNVGDNTIPASTLWVNGQYVRQIPAIPARASATVGYGELIQAGPGVQTLHQLNQPVTKVELQTSNGLYTVEGPARVQ